MNIGGPEHCGMCSHTGKEMGPHLSLGSLPLKSREARLLPHPVQISHQSKRSVRVDGASYWENFSDQMIDESYSKKQQKAIEDRDAAIKSLRAEAAAREAEMGKLRAQVQTLHRKLHPQAPCKGAAILWQRLPDLWKITSMTFVILP